jgi:hypothetical protein
MVSKQFPETQIVVLAFKTQAEEMDIWSRMYNNFITSCRWLAENICTPKSLNTTDVSVHSILNQFFDYMLHAGLRRYLRHVGEFKYLKQNYPRNFIVIMNSISKYEIITSYNM